MTAADKLSAEQFTEQIASTEGIAADRLELVQKGLDLDWWEARGDQAAGVLDRQLEKKQFELLEDKFALIEDQFTWDQAMDIAELGDQDFNLGTQLSLHAGSIEGGAAVMQEVADYMYNNNINADNTGYAHALAALGYGTVLTFLYTQQFMEDGTPQEVAESLADAAVDALKETSGASAGPVADPADKVKTAAPIEQTTRERVFIDGTNNPKPQGNVRTLDTNKLVLEGFSGYRDAEGNYYENQWKAPSHDTGRTAVVDTTGDITGIPMGQYYVDDNGIIIDVQSGGNKSAINTKAPEGWDRR